MNATTDPHPRGLSGGQAVVTRRRILRLGVAGAGALIVTATRAADDAPGRRARRGMIFTTANLGTKVEGVAESESVIAIDPETRAQTTVLDGCHVRPRVSPDGRTLAFSRGDAVWTRSVAGGDEPKRVLGLEGTDSASAPVWSPDGRQLVVSLGTMGKERGPWVFKTVRVNTDGTGRTECKIPTADGVHDWSADGRWFVTASSRNAEIGWQLYVMHPDGTGVRQITEGGNPFYSRFSPDGRRVLYSDGTTDERRGIWVVGVDGTGRRKVCSTGQASASACWSPDGTRIAVAVHYSRLPQATRDRVLIEVMDLDGKQESLIELPEGSTPDMPDWR